MPTAPLLQFLLDAPAEQRWWQAGETQDGLDAKVDIDWAAPRGQRIQQAAAGPSF